MTAVEWLVKSLELDTRFNGIMNDVIEQAKEMENKQREEKDNIISEIDFELAMIEDYAHGEVGNAITNLRHKIQQYYGKE